MPYALLSKKGHGNRAKTGHCEMGSGCSEQSESCYVFEENPVTSLLMKNHGQVVRCISTCGFEAGGP